MKQTLHLNLSELSQADSKALLRMFKKQHGEAFTKMLDKQHSISVAVGGSQYEEKGNPTYIVSSETFRLIPIGNIIFKSKSNSRATTYEPLFMGDVSFLERYKISNEKMNELHKIMKKNKTDILTDGHKFYSTFGECLGVVEHKRFDELLKENDDKIRELLYS